MEFATMVGALRGAAGPRKGIFPPFGFARFTSLLSAHSCGRWARLKGGRRMSVNPQAVRLNAVRLNLEYYQKAAKSLLKSAQSGDADALERVARHSPKPGRPPRLHQAQLTIARELGVASAA